VTIPLKKASCSTMPGLFHLELQLLANAVLVCLLSSHWRGWRVWRRVVRWCVATAARPVWLAGMGVFVGCAVAGLHHVPVPAAHDEFAYLLTADTFAHGRLTNPTHPLWRSLEVPHVFHQPTYQAKYPPLQGAVLALGQAVFGQPIVGVWLSYAAACAAVVWMLEAWAPRRWAAWGGLLCVLNPCLTLGWIPSYTGAFGQVYSCGWGQSYWGGAVAMFGGALVFGAVPRWAKSGQARQVALLALGLIVLAHSRPYEGLVAAGLPMLWFAVSTVPLLRKSPGRVALALAAGFAVLAAGALPLLTYNFAVTGDAGKLPYQVWKETYSRGGLATTLFWSGVERNQNVLTKLLIEWEFFVRTLLTLPLGLGVLRALGCGKYRLAVLACLLTLAAVLLQNTRGNPHYLAAVVAPFTAVCVLGMRQLSVWRWQRLPVGTACVRGLLAVYAVSFVLMVEQHWIREPVPPTWEWSVWRARIEDHLASRSGRHLVLVRYRGSHKWHHEWCYNSAAIDESPVVWVKSHSAEQDAAVRRHFSARQCWVIEADDDDPPLISCEATSG
jgi:hypothetical protein